MEKIKTEKGLEACKQELQQDFKNRLKNNPSESPAVLLDNMALEKQKELEELREKYKQEFMHKLKCKLSEPPDLQEVLKELRKKTDALDTGEIPGNLDRIDQMKYAYALAAKYTSGFNVTIEMGEDDPFPDMGYVEIEGNLVEFTNTEFFTRMVSFSDSMEIYSLANGKIRITLTFRDLSQKNSEGGIL